MRSGLWVWMVREGRPEGRKACAGAVLRARQGDRCGKDVGLVGVGDIVNLS